MTIVVSADHVRAGEIGSCFDCPIGLAIRERIPRVRCALVERSQVRLVVGRREIIIPLPSVARAFIQAFDAGVDVAPIEFELPIDLDPDPTNTPAALAA